MIVAIIFFIGSLLCCIMDLATMGSEIIPTFTKFKDISTSTKL